MDTWFIGDTHFGHKNILAYEPGARPFATIEEMNEAIVERWNKVVKPNDRVYHLGDFCFGRQNLAIAGRLLGTKILVLGNHDQYSANEYLRYFKSMHGVTFWGQYVLSHVPVHTSQLEHRSKFCIHGHLHSKKIDDPRYINVSCEQNNLTPIHFEELHVKS